ncbi:hypothetical protein F4678DRAFT_421115 [Xylaria arbuscula]|nr:hypothetical protein F4678DRAFT_421115 [Xylaria arbuscula]
MFPCNRTENGSHIGHTPAPFRDQPPQGSVLLINGEVLEEGIEGYIIVSSCASDG